MPAKRQPKIDPVIVELTEEIQRLYQEKGDTDAFDHAKRKAVQRRGFKRVNEYINRLTPYMRSLGLAEQMTAGDFMRGKHLFAGKVRKLVSQKWDGSLEI